MVLFSRPSLVKPHGLHWTLLFNLRLRVGPQQYITYPYLQLNAALGTVIGYAVHQYDRSLYLYGESRLLLIRLDLIRYQPKLLSMV